MLKYLPAEDDMVHDGGKFVCKPCNLSYAKAMLKTWKLSTEKFMIREFVVLDQPEWAKFTAQLLDEYEFLKGKGGYYAESYGSVVRICVAVLQGKFEGKELGDVDLNHFLIVDPQGSAQASYLTLSDHYVRLRGRAGLDYHRLLVQVREEVAKIKRPAVTGRITKSK